jgi:hypothetical protein
MSLMLIYLDVQKKSLTVTDTVTLSENFWQKPNKVFL